MGTETISSLIKAKYERTALKYSRKERQDYWLYFNLEKLKNFLNTHPIHQVIDIGCGSGALIRSLAFEYPGIQFTGIDFSKKLIEIAKSHAKTDNLQFLCRDFVEYQNHIVKELSFKDQKVLMLLIGPFEYYHHQNLFTKAVRRVWGEITQGAMIVTYHNKDMWLRSFIKGKRKQYWDEKDSLTYWGDGAKLVESEYFHFFFFDFLVTRIRWPWSHIFFLSLEKGLKRFPESVQKKISTTLLHIFQKNLEELHN
ncbi:MAG: class I SAM-dependent methyltransferase [Candidatus Omnitrophota bacterium]